MDTKEKIIAKFGGTNSVAEICGVTPGAVSQWDLIPAKHQIKLLNEAKARHLRLSAEDFMATTSPRETKRNDAARAASSRELTGAEIVIQSMLDCGTEVVFGYPGGAVLPVYDALFKQNNMSKVRATRQKVTPAAPANAAC
jgi:hypothetical protein